MKNSLRQDLNTKMSLIVIACVLFTSVFIAVFSWKKIWEHHQTTHFYFLEHSKLTIDSWFEEHLRKLLFVSQIEDLILKDKPFQQNLLDSIIQSHSAVDEISIVDKSGTMMCNQDRYFTGNEFSIPFDYSATNSDGLEIYQLVKQADKRFALFVSYPLRSSQGQISGALITKLNLNYLNYLISTLKFGEYGYAYIIDQNNNILAKPNVWKQETINNNDKLNYLSLIGRERTFQTYQNVLNARVIGMFDMVEELNWFLIVEQPFTEIQHDMYRLFFIVFLCALLGLILARKVATRFHKNIADGLNDLEQAAEAIAVGNLSYTVKKLHDNELGRFAHAFNIMTYQLKHLFQQQDTRLLLEKLLSDISRCAMNSKHPYLQNFLTNIQALCSDFLVTDRCCIYLIDETSSMMVCKYEWYRDETIKQVDPGLLRIELDKFPALKLALSMGQVFIYDRSMRSSLLKDIYGFIPAETDLGNCKLEDTLVYRALESEGVAFMIVLPLIEADKPIGMITFGSLNSSKNIKIEKNDLEILSGVITSSLLYCKSRQSLSDEHDKLQTTLHCLGDAVIACDTNGMIKLINPVAENLTGWTGQEAIGKQLEDVFKVIDVSSGKPIENPVKSVLAAKQKIELAKNSLLSRKDNAKHYIADSAAPIMDSESNILGVVLVFRDVSDLIEQDQEKTRMQRLEAISLLSAGIAHDFNNLLTSILGNISLAKDLIPHYSEAAKILTSAEFSTEKGKDLINQMLLYSKGGVSEKKIISVSNTINNIASFLLRDSRVNVEQVIDSELHGVEIPEGIFNQIFSNIVINAKQAIEEFGMIRIQAKNVLHPYPSSQTNLSETFIEIMVSDNGSGISQDVIDKIFEPYFTTKKSGTGLGLTSAKTLLEKYGGFIKISSGKNTGGADYNTSVSVYLPAIPIEQETQPSSTTNRVRVLVHESDKVMQNFFTKSLTSLGIDSVITGSFVDMMEWFKINSCSGNAFDCVILNTYKTESNFLKSLMSELLSINPKQIIICCGIDISDDDKKTLQNMGVSEFINKPFHYSELRNIFIKLGIVVSG